jgi:AmmeMemoRadiSam system protein B
MVRRPAVSGQFYPASAGELRAMLESFDPIAEQKGAALAALCPHAGYVFSGAVAGKTLGGIRVPDTVLVLNPSHHVARPGFALWDGGDWQTPLGAVPLHAPLTEALAKLPLVDVDARAHGPEHAAEVLLPFLQYYNPDVRIAVVCVTASAGLEALKQFGRSCAGVLADCGEQDGLVLASSDLSHESGLRALHVVKAHDSLVIEQMEKLDPDGLYRVAREQRVTMCGVLPAVAAMASAQARGATAGKLIARATSADSPRGGGSYVVGYAGMVFR